jgi:hypothetical protein
MDNYNQAIYSISSICRILKLSRGQFYILQKVGIFPSSLKDEKTKRSYYNEEMKTICLEIKKTGIGFNGQYHLFYETRKEPGKPCKKRNGENGKYTDIIEMLKSMGISNITTKEIENALLKILQLRKLKMLF